MTTKICKKCNTEKSITEFYYNKKKDTYETNCNSCLSLYRKEYREKNKEKAKQYASNWRTINEQRKKELDRKYRENNIEKIKECRKKYAIDNSKKLIEKSKKWYQLNKERAKATKKEYNKIYKTTESYRLSNKIQRIKRRKQLKNTKNQVTSKVLKEIIDKSSNCYWCNKPLKYDYHIDHYIPLSKGGEHTITNLVISCPDCNLKKHAKDPYEFANSIGRLL